MKRIAIAIVIILGVVLYYATTNEVAYIAPEEVLVEKEVDALEQAIKTAQESKLSEIEGVAQEAYQSAYDQEMKKVELQVVSDFNKKLDARQIELEKETKVH